MYNSRAKYVQVYEMVARSNDGGNDKWIGNMKGTGGEVGVGRLDVDGKVILKWT
jgi:hypothetical protein